MVQPTEAKPRKLTDEELAAGVTPPETAGAYFPPVQSPYTPESSAYQPPPPAYATEPQGGNDTTYQYSQQTPLGPKDYTGIHDPAISSQPYTAPTGVDVETPNPSRDASRLGRKIGGIGSWWNTPTTPDTVGTVKPKDFPTNIGTAWGAIAEAGRAAHDYWGRPLRLATDVANQLMTYDQLQSTYPDYPMPADRPPAQTPGTAALMDSVQRLPEPIQHLSGIARTQYMAPSMSLPMTESAYKAYDATDAYMGIDEPYLSRMQILPEYMRPFTPAIARAAHAIRALPDSPSYFNFAADAPFPVPGMEGRPTFQRGTGEPPSSETPVAAGQFPPLPPLPDDQGRWGNVTLEPNAYYDDPYIPGPDKGRKRRIA